MNKYGLDEDIDDSEEQEEDVTSKVDRVLEFKRLDESNPLERFKKFTMIKENPPNPDFMKVEVFEGRDADGTPIVKSVSSQGTYEEDPFLIINPYMLFQGNIAASPINSVSTILELLKGVVREEKIFKREKREKEFPWGWLIIGLSLIPGILLLLFWIF